MPLDPWATIGVPATDSVLLGAKDSWSMVEQLLQRLSRDSLGPKRLGRMGFTYDFCQCREQS